MELKLSELDNVNTMNPYEKFDYNSYQQDGLNYWEKSEKKNLETKTKKKKVTFNDILSNMNLVVNKQGVLQFMGPGQQEAQQQQQQPIYQPMYNQEQPVYNQNNIRQVQYQGSQQMNSIPQQNINPEPVDPALKHSYIYNKYFKDYADPNAQKQGPRVPKTIQEYHQMLLDDKIKEIQHKKRVEQIKSKKILFTPAQGAQFNPRNIQASKNNLRSMSFR
jgi:hypothetical protein